MSNKKSTMRALVLCGLAMLLSVSMLAGTTFAWFTDSVESGNNKIVAGNLDIEVDYLANGEWTTVEGESEIFDPAARWEPGHVEVAYFRVKNAGTLALKYSLLMNVVKYGEGTNVYDEYFRLADFIQISIVEDVNGKEAAYATRTDAVAAATAPGQVPRLLGDATAERVSNDELLSGKEEFFAVVIWMPEEVDNHANYKKGTDAPVVEFGVHVIATQTPYENDSFDKNYDANIDLGNFAIGSAQKDGNDYLYLEAIDGAGYKAAYAHVPEEAMAGDKVDIKVEKVDVDGRITVAANETAKTYNITLDGIKEGNTADIKVGFRIDQGLDSNYIKLYHEDQEIEFISYNSVTGYIEFNTTGFSPFTAVFDTSKTAPAPDVEGNTIDLKAEVTPWNEVENVILDWESYNGICPSDLDQKLETAYVFKAPHNDDTIGDCDYRAWECDYVVSIDKDIPAGALFLGGNYGSFGWVGFENPESVEANTEIYLLGSVMQGGAWTYEDIATWVNTFGCGVAKANGYTGDLKGATFTVMLRVTAPDGTYYNVNTVSYTFGAEFGAGTSIIDGVTEQ